MLASRLSRFNDLTRNTGEIIRVILGCPFSKGSNETEGRDSAGAQDMQKHVPPHGLTLRRGRRAREC
jgi:hypothetical protein